MDLKGCFLMTFYCPFFKEKDIWISNFQVTYILYCSERTPKDTQTKYGGSTLPKNENLTMFITRKGTMHWTNSGSWKRVTWPNGSDGLLVAWTDGCWARLPGQSFGFVIVHKATHINHTDK